MSEETKHNDAFADDNLRALARRIELPAEPTQAQMRRWKHSTAASQPVLHNDEPQPRKQGGWIMRHPRIATVAGSAAAAGVGLAAFLFVTPHGSVVEAAVILKSFRQSLTQGFRLTIENVGDDHAVVNGEVLIEFREGLDSLSTATPDDILAAYLDVQVQTDEQAEEMPGLDVHVAMAMSELGEWIYLRLLGLDEELEDIHPAAAAILRMTEGGLLLRIDGVLDALDDTFDVDVAREVLGAIGDAQEGVREGLGEIEVAVDTGADAPGADSDDRVNLSVTGAVHGAGEADVLRLVRALILGNAGEAELDELYAHIEQAAQNVTLQQVEPGLYVLNISGLDVDELDADEDAEMLARIQFEIVYREGSGVESASIENIGERNGAIAFQFGGVQIPAELLDMQRMMQPGVSVWDVSALVPVLQDISAHSEP